MKVELDNITLGHSPLTDSIFAGVSNMTKEGFYSWKHKKDVTNEFLHCVVQRWQDKTETTDNGVDKWEITVKKLS